MNNKTSPTRKVDVQVTDNGAPFAYSMTSHKSIQVNAEVQPPLQLPGLIIFVHGVNSEGEWYDYAEEALCDGLNNRLGLNGEHILSANKYAKGDWESCDKNSAEWNGCYRDNMDDEKKQKWTIPPRKITEEGRSPVIRFYWGYRAADDETDNTLFKKAGSGSIQSVMKSFEPSTFDEKFVITHPVSGKPLANQNYDVHLPDGSVVSGITDDQGNLSLITSKAIDGLKIILKK